MTSPAICVQLGDRLSDARHLVCEHGVHHIPVVSAGVLIGMLSSTDLISLGFGNDAARVGPVEAFLDHNYSIQGLMTREPVQIGANQPISKAARMLRTGKYHGLPVVDPGGKLVGIVTSTDLIGLLCGEAD